MASTLKTKVWVSHRISKVKNKANTLKSSIIYVFLSLRCLSLSVRHVILHFAYCNYSPPPPSLSDLSPSAPHHQLVSQSLLRRRLIRWTHREHWPEPSPSPSHSPPTPEEPRSGSQTGLQSQKGHILKWKYWAELWKSTTLEDQTSKLLKGGVILSVKLMKLSKGRNSIWRAGTRLKIRVRILFVLQTTHYINKTILFNYFHHIQTV